MCAQAVKRTLYAKQMCLNDVFLHSTPTYSQHIDENQLDWSKKITASVKFLICAIAYGNRNGYCVLHYCIFFNTVARVGGFVTCHFIHIINLRDFFINHFINYHRLVTTRIDLILTLVHCDMIAYIKLMTVKIAFLCWVNKCHLLLAKLANTK